MSATAGGRRRDDVRLVSHLELEVRSIPLRNAYSDWSERQVLRRQRIPHFQFRFSISALHFTEVKNEKLQH